nr:Chain C, IPA from Hemagglutinin glycoprotein [synthetic construct]3PWV_C Chain C, 9-mer peptide from Hemagglutinin [Rinderpest morbillivirus]3PWV_F Chain F, 9-mer peptide from Hemagglutinin [Rinderpest morbillivirus]
IPAYGVLTI